MITADLYWMWGSNDKEYTKLEEHVLFQRVRGRVLRVFVLEDLVYANCKI